MSDSFPSNSSLEIVTTKDGSQTVLNKALGSTYHSRHGAFTESQHVFIGKGLRKLLDNGVMKITLLEMGFGTGLNALLTLQSVLDTKVEIDYHGLEVNPLPASLLKNYTLPEESVMMASQFETMHSSSWNEATAISDQFMLTKHQVELQHYLPKVNFDLVYYDAFEPETQPELWTIEVFEKLFSWMKQGGILTTYCCKGYVKRNMIAAGFEVEKVPGPPGKREMICATKPL